MSTTYKLVCKDCKKGLWVGQSCYIYSAGDAIPKLAEFLHNHFKHPLQFVSEHEIYDWSDVGDVYEIDFYSSDKPVEYPYDNSEGARERWIKSLERPSMNGLSIPDRPKDPSFEGTDNH